MVKNYVKTLKAGFPTRFGVWSIIYQLELDCKEELGRMK